MVGLKILVFVFLAAFVAVDAQRKKCSFEEKKSSMVGMLTTAEAGAKKVKEVLKAAEEKLGEEGIKCKDVKIPRIGWKWLTKAFGEACEEGTGGATGGTGGATGGTGGATGGTGGATGGTGGATGGTGGATGGTGGATGGTGGATGGTGGSTGGTGGATAVEVEDQEIEIAANEEACPKKAEKMKLLKCAVGLMEANVKTAKSKIGALGADSKCRDVRKAMKGLDKGLRWLKWQGLTPEEKKKIIAERKEKRKNKKNNKKKNKKNNKKNNKRKNKKNNKKKNKKTTPAPPAPPATAPPVEPEATAPPVEPEATAPPVEPEATAPPVEPEEPAEPAGEVE